jgi:hypothetical protein
VFNQGIVNPLAGVGNGHVSDFPGDNPLPEASPFHEDKIPF